MNARKAIGYARVSDQKQTKSSMNCSLGIEAQSDAIRKFCSDNNYQLLELYQEVQSGRDDDRPQLQKALSHARACDATLICKLDRMARHLAFFTKLLESGTRIVFYDYPTADKFTLHIMASVAEKEVHDISARTKAALAVLKKNGKVLGNPRGFQGRRDITDRGREMAKIVTRQNLRAWLKNVGPMIAMSYENEDGHLLGTAKNLEGKGITTRFGRPTWTHQAVRTVFRQLEREGLLQEAIQNTDHKDDPQFFLCNDRRRYYRTYQPPSEEQGGETQSWVESQPNVEESIGNEENEENATAVL